MSTSWWGPLTTAMKTLLDALAPLSPNAGTPPNDGEVPIYDVASSTWLPGAASGGPALSDAAPQAVGTAAAGASADASRADHVHAAAAANVTAAVGTNTYAVTGDVQGDLDALDAAVVAAGGLTQLGYAEYTSWADNTIKTLTLDTAMATLAKAHVDVWQETPYETDANTLLLVCSEHSDGSVVFSDFSLSQRIVTPYAQTQHDTAQAKFGNSSIYINNTSETSLQIPASADFSFGTGDFTIEFWVRRSGGSWFSGLSTQGTTGYTILLGYNDALYVAKTGSGSWDVFNAAAIGTSANTWHHIALVRYGTSLKLYRDGTAVAACTATVAAGDTFGSSTLGWQMGRWGGAYCEMWVEDLRISNTARYTADFTAPGSLWPATVSWVQKFDYTPWLTNTSTLKIRSPITIGSRTARVYVSGTA